MAKYEIFGSISLTPEGFFPIGGNPEISTGDNQRDYSFTIGDETRIVEVHWGEQFSVDTIRLRGAGNELLAEITGLSVNRDQFQSLWLHHATTSSQVFSFLLSSDDELIGNDAENIFAPGLGNDTIFGGNNGPEFFDYVDYSADNRQHGITVDLVDGDADDDMGKVTSRGGAPETDFLNSINGIYATAHNDLLIGDNRDNEFYAGFGNDTIHGGGSNGNLDVLSYRPDGRTQGITVTFTAEGAGKITSNENGGEEDVFTGIEAVYGTAGADSFTGEAGFQRFRGFAGNDTFDGGDGNDEVDYRSDTAEVPGRAGIIVDLSNVDGEGRVTVAGANRDVDTLISIEQIRGTRNDDAITGTNANNRLRGDAGDDELDGRGGDDRLEGGNGNDTVLGGDGNDMLFGDAGNDTVNGGAGWDTLDGGAGDDRLIGGVGAPTDEDVFIGSIGSDTIFGGDLEEPDGENSWNEINYYTGNFAGITVTFTASDGRYGVGTVEKKDGNGVVIGTDHFYDINAIRGTMGADKFIGGDSAGVQRFIGYEGNDTFDGSLGVNEIDYRAEARAAQSTSGVSVDLAAETATYRGFTDKLIAIERIRGTENADTIAGDRLHNLLRGDAGNDTLSGRNGNDTLNGGAGNDTAIFDGSRADYHVVNAGTTLTVEDQRSGGEGTDTVIDVEFFNFNGTLLNLAEVINHGSAVDLTGGMVFENSKAGETVGMLSVANPDALSVHGFELINDAGGRFQIDSSGRITVRNGLLLDYEQAATHTIAVRAQDQFGKVVDQTLTVVLKDVDKESATGTAGGDTVSGGANADTLSGGGGNDVLNAGGGKDRVDGGIGNDRIIGGGGQDTLTGGAGKDVFAFGNKDTGTSKGTADTITDFSGKGGDKIDLKAIDADVKKKGDQAFSFIGKNAFTKAGQVRYEKTSKETFIYLNTDSDKAAEGVIKLKGALDMQKGWFVL